MTKYKVVLVKKTICGVAISEQYANELKKEVEDFYKDEDGVSVIVEKLKKDDKY